MCYCIYVCVHTYAYIFLIVYACVPGYFWIGNNLIVYKGPVWSKTNYFYILP